MNKILYDYFGLLWLIIGLFEAYNGIMPRNESYTVQRIFHIPFGGILIGYGIAKFRTPPIQVCREKVIICSKGLREITFDEITSCTYSSIWGTLQLNHVDGTEVKSKISLIRSQSQVVKIAEETNSRISAQNQRVHPDARHPAARR